MCCPLLALLSSTCSSCSNPPQSSLSPMLPTRNGCQLHLSQRFLHGSSMSPPSLPDAGEMVSLGKSMRRYSWPKSSCARSFASTCCSSQPWQTSVKRWVHVSHHMHHSSNFQARKAERPLRFPCFSLHVLCRPRMSTSSTWPPTELYSAWGRATCRRPTHPRPHFLH